MLLVLHVQVLESGHERLRLEASGCPRHHGRVTNGAVGADGHHVASQGGAHVAGLVHSLGHTAQVEPPAEVNAVQHLREPAGRHAWGKA